MRSVRRATARRASSRRAFARSRQTDTETRIIEFVAHHPGATIGDLARSLNFPVEHIASCLTQLTSAGELQRRAHGYSTPNPQPSRAARPVGPAAV
jgi:predicted ArsR family transcriptional regulator